MATFTGTTGNDVADATGAGTLTGFAGGSLAELTDAVGDSINGAAGADLIVAGAGADTLVGSTGEDILIGGAGADRITDVGDVGERLSIDAGDGDDFIDIGDRVPLGGVVEGGVGRDTLRAQRDITKLDIRNVEILMTGDWTTGARVDQFEAFDAIIKSAFSPKDLVWLTILPTGASTILDLTDELAGEGGPRRATVTGSSDSERIMLGAEGGQIEGVGGDDILFGGARTNSLTGGDGNDVLTGGAVGDWLHGGAGNDEVNGLAGDDSMSFDGGADTFNGGDGVDVVEVRTSSPITLTVAGGDFTAPIAGLGVARFVAIEGIIGAGGADSLTGDGGANSLDGAAGADSLVGLSGNDTLIGRDGDDSLIGGDGNDFLDDGYFMGGRLSIDAGAGDDVIDVGLNTLNIPAGASRSGVVDGGAGRDTMLAGGADLTTFTYSGVEVLATNGSFITTGFAAQFEAFEAIISSLPGGDDRFVYPVSILLKATGAPTSLDLTEEVVAGGNFRLAYVDGSSDSERIAIGPGRLLIRGFGGNDTLIGDAFDDTLSGGDGDDQLAGGAGKDTLYGDAGLDTLSGEGGNDWLEAAAGDVLFGGDGLDAAIFPTVSAVSITLGDDVTVTTADTGATRLVSVESLFVGVTRFNASSGSAADTLIGNDAANELGANFGNDSLVGLGGADTLIGWFGNDTLDGGAGQDVANLSNAVTNLTLSANPGEFTVVLNTIPGSEETDTLRSIEGFVGGIGNDTLIGDATSNVLIGNNGNDALIGLDGDDTLQSERTGFLGYDLMFGGGGNDDISKFGFPSSSSSTVYVEGGFGDDRISLGRSDVSTSRESLWDYVFGDNADDSGVGADTIIKFDEGRFYASGGGGNDSIVGSYFFSGPAGQVNEYLFGDGGADTIRGESSNDAVIGSNYADANPDPGGDPVDSLSGGSGDDYVLQGKWGRGVLSGDSGKDTIVGASGADTLTGGSGDDFLFGNGGGDVYRFAAADLASGGQDILYDGYAAGWTIQLSGVTATETQFFALGAEYVAITVAAGGGAHTILIGVFGLTSLAQVQANTQFV